MIRTGTFRYVTWHSVESFIEAGWIPGVVISEYSVIMWACACNQAGEEP